MSTSWTEYAACLGHGDLMFPTPGDEKGKKAARNLCDRCPVTRECLIDALQAEGNATADYRHGIRAHTTPSQRRRLYEKYGRDTAPEQTRLLAPCGTPAAYRRHHRRDEPIDEACRDANRQLQRAKAEKAAASGSARSRAQVEQAA